MILSSRRTPEFFYQASPDVGSNHGDLVNIEADGDLHVDLQDATGDKAGHHCLRSAGEAAISRDSSIIDRSPSQYRLIGLHFGGQRRFI